MSNVPKVSATPTNVVNAIAAMPVDILTLLMPVVLVEVLHVHKVSVTIGKEVLATVAIHADSRTKVRQVRVATAVGLVVNVEKEDLPVYVSISKKEDAIVVMDVDFHTTVLQVEVGIVHKANVLIFKKGTAVEVKDVDFHMNKFDVTNEANGNIYFEQAISISQKI